MEESKKTKSFFEKAKKADNGNDNENDNDNVNANDNGNGNGNGNDNDNANGNGVGEAEPFLCVSEGVSDSISEPISDPISDLAPLTEEDRKVKNEREPPHHRQYVIRRLLREARRLPYKRFVRFYDGRKDGNIRSVCLVTG